MKVEYSNRAIANLHKISADSRRAFGDQVAQALEVRIRAVIDLIAREPLSAPEVEQRPGLRVAALVRYPFKIGCSMVTSELFTSGTHPAARGAEASKKTFAA